MGNRHAPQSPCASQAEAVCKLAAGRPSRGTLVEKRIYEIALLQRHQKHAPSIVVLTVSLSTAPPAAPSGQHAFARLMANGQAEYGRTQLLTAADVAVCYAADTAKGKLAQ